ncbi:MAG: hypothetical protein KDA32_07410 [Phycisphaerales bacterium]|nr:hypothetical protein [Phycisphaerales bacterium]
MLEQQEPASGFWHSIGEALTPIWNGFAALMSPVVGALNEPLAAITHAVIGLFGGFPSSVPLIVISLVSGLIAGICFKYTSYQRGLKRVADETRASMLALRLYKESLAVTLTEMGRLAKLIFLRLLYSIPPMLVMMIPFVMLLGQLAMYFQFQPLRPDQPGMTPRDYLVQVKLSESAWPTHQALVLEPPAGVRVTSGPARGLDDHSLNWNIHADKPVGLTEIAFKLDDKVIATKHLTIAAPSDELVFADPIRPGTSFLDRVLYPGEQPFGSDSPIVEIRVPHEDRINTLFGLRIPWWATFLVASILGAVLLKPFMKVQF